MLDFDSWELFQSKKVNIINTIYYGSKIVFKQPRYKNIAYFSYI